ncbi:MAG TPA: glycosyltransferase 87 family protein [Dehalococcoidia bacterium]|nr:glycosyltransferase 87 family protein [Dehalococcoidia bacterium]
MGAVRIVGRYKDSAFIWARSAVAAVVIGVSVAMLILAIRGWTIDDASAYWQAALRLREGLPLYPAYPDPGSSDVYRYAPWFAYLWVPVTYLPKGWVLSAWTLVLVAASVASVAGLARERGLTPRLLAMLFGSMLIWTAARGNVQPLITLAVVAGLPRWSGPLWVGLAASLKGVPIAFALVYVARRDWKAAAWSFVIAAVLILPMAPLGWTPIDPGPSMSLYYQASPIVWAVVACVALGAAVVLAVRASNYTPVGAGVMAILALPRLLVYDLTFLVPSVAKFTSSDRDVPPDSS